MAKKNLQRSLTSRKIAGVCGGLGEYFGITPSIFRVAFLLLCLPGGVPGPLLYVLFWIFMPSAPLNIHIANTFSNMNKPNNGSQLGDDYTETIDV